MNHLPLIDSIYARLDEQRRTLMKLELQLFIRTTLNLDMETPVEWVGDVNTLRVVHNGTTHRIMKRAIPRRVWPLISEK